MKHIDPDGRYEIFIDLKKNRMSNNDGNVFDFIRSESVDFNFRAELFVRVRNIKNRYVIQHTSNNKVQYTLHVFLPLTGDSSRQQNSQSKTPEPEPVLISDQGKLLVTNVTLKGVLSGEHYIDTSMTMKHSCILNHIYVKLEFLSFSFWSSPADLIMAILSPSGGKVIIMAAPESPHWPSNWYSHENGTYKAIYNVHQLSLFGLGNWTIAMRNSYSLSGNVEYSLFLRLEFVCGNNHNPVLMTPTIQPNYLPTSSPSLISSPIQHLNYQTIHTIHIPPNTLLGVIVTSKGIAKQDRIRIANFNMHGIVLIISIKLN
jgi:hypothetical protein